MNLAQDYRPGAVKPMVCLSEGWRLIKEEYWLFLGITLAGLFIGSLAALFLMGPLTCGIHYCLLRKENHQRLEFGMLFRGFDYFLPSLVVTLIMAAPIFVFAIVAYLLFVAGIIGTFAAFAPGQGQPLDPVALVIMAVLFALYFFALTIVPEMIKTLFFFCYPLIVDRGLSGMDAVKLSFRAVLGNFWGLVGLMLLMELLALVGVLACYVGVIFVLPLTFAMTSVAYQQVFGREISDLEPDDDLYKLPAPSAGQAETGIKGKRRENETAVEPDITSGTS